MREKAKEWQIAETLVDNAIVHTIYLDNKLYQIQSLCWVNAQ